MTGASRSGDSVTVSLEKKDGSAKEDVTADVVLVSVGRRPYTNNLGLESVGIVLDDKGRVPVNGRFQTIVPRYGQRNRFGQSTHGFNLPSFILSASMRLVM